MLSSAIAAAQECRVVGVSDGDTLTCLANDNKQIKVRLAQIDAPESRQGFGTQAKQYLSGLVFNQVVKLKISDTDKYGRTIAEVYKGGMNVNKEMVRTGYAWAYDEYMTDREYATLQQGAKIAQRGLWRNPNAVKPSDFRRGVKEFAAPKLKVQEIKRYGSSSYGKSNYNAYKTPTYNTSPSYSYSSPSSSYSNISGDKTVYVQGYYRKDGTYVAPHTRSRPSK